jgi:cell wall-associated NlpC family hydrolase
MAYCQLDPEKLEPGDVILEAGTGIISQGIKFVDAGLLNTSGIGDAPAFSHVFLYVGMNLIMEADEDVRSLLASRVITEHPRTFSSCDIPNSSGRLQSPSGN